MPPKSAVARKRRREREELKQLLLVGGDALVTAIWVLLSCTFAEAAEALSEISGIGEFALAVAVTVIGLLMMGPMCDMFGGALFNPVHNAAFVCAGKGTLTLNSLRMVGTDFANLGHTRCLSRAADSTQTARYRVLHRSAALV
eukprot:GHUV01012705.1.p1 GENE.GHUV01012705.1~~GHUV01012705.1.p1  ORF type:complete len:143 (+),score=20.50 GHUV01012705.1:186-614(+)